MIDVTVAGAGPNGLAAAIYLTTNGCRALVLEAEAAAGGAVRSVELTLPGFKHDLGSAVHPLAAASPYFRTLPLDRHGLQWIEPLARNPFSGNPLASCAPCSINMNSPTR
jgi:phytoene dehydrogenase-like protein